jgi:uncharacterized protein
VAVAEQKLLQPGFWMAVLLALLVMGIQIALSIPFTIADFVLQFGMHQPPLHLATQPIVLGGINIMALGGATALGLWQNRLSFQRAFPGWWISAHQALGVAVSLIGAIVLSSQAENAVRYILPPSQFFIELMKQIFLSQNVVSRVWLLVIVAPITEELLFRGIILRGLLSRYRPATAVVITALLFAFIHLNPWQFFSALFLGLVLGWFYARTRSVAICILGHAIQNSMSVIFSVVPWDIPGMTAPPELSTVEFQPWWLNTFGLIVMLAGLWIFRRSSPPAPPIIDEVTKNSVDSSQPS